jgi:hypothetical protein
VVLEPREERELWTIYSAQGTETPVKRLALNYGAPGDRRDSFGGLWLGYPRPKTVGRLEYEFTVPTTLAEGGAYVSLNEESAKVTGADVPWLFSSIADGLLKTELTLLGKDDPPARYSVSLYFAEFENAQAGERVFDVKLQGETVAERLDVAAEAGGARQALIKKFSGVNVSDKLIIELVPRGDARPILSAVEVVRD